jgi:hypothetical protein
MSDILHKAITFLKNKVKDYSNGADIIEIANVSTLNDGDEFLEASAPIILSIVNIEEEKLARNPDIFIRPDTSLKNIKVLKKHPNPAQHLNISLLFSAYNKDRSKYVDGISKLEFVIRCFQEKHVFYIDDQGDEVDSPNTDEHYKLILDLVSLKFSELNQLWSVLGSKYLPSVLYKMRLIMIQTDEKTEKEIIKKAKIKLWDTANKNDLAGQLEETEYFTK